ncbi:MAG TPA: tetratricopeptide repeat protein [Actinobacteria bacterium]|nr:tetratricopeptide repeat protein [Actinomycetota bacterium]
MATKSTKKNKDPIVEQEISEFTDETTTGRDTKKLVFGIWFVIIFGLLAAFIVTTNQNVGDTVNTLPADVQNKEELANKLKPYQDQLAQDPKNTTALINIGFTYFEARQFEDATENFQKAIDLDEKNIMAITGLGMAYQYNSRPNEAKEMFDKALALDPDDHLAKTRKAYFLAEIEQKYDDALKLLREVEAKLPESENKKTIQSAIADIEKRAQP